jgi:glycosyltransferase involved in cell wall biosynthesis
LIRTLESINKSAFGDFEVIVVDDASKEEERLEDLAYPFLKIVRVEPKDKWYHNACMPINMGIRESKGDVVIIQNPECLHVHDVLTYVNKNIRSDNFISMSAYSIDEKMTISIDETLSRFDKLPQHSVTKDYVGWYNHSVYRPVYYNFCCAITRQNLYVLGGFDERYANGTGYEDDDFIDRIKRLGLKMIIPDDVSVIHQWHPKVYNINNPVHARMFRDNMLLHKVTQKESYIHVNG